MKISFVGHAVVSSVDDIKQIVKEQVRYNITNTDSAICYLGGYGDFDELCAVACRELKAEHPCIELIYVAPYITLREQAKIKELQKAGLCDTSVYPPIEKTPLKFAISKRNEWMVRNADLVIAYVKRSWGGAYKTIKTAEKMRKKIINVGDLI